MVSLHRPFQPRSKPHRDPVRIDESDPLLCEPRQCPRCSDPRGPFDYDAETDSWTCSRCAATWCASVPERHR